MKGKVALVTGAGSGIGAAGARALAALGVRVGVLSRTASEVEQVAAEINEAGGESIPLVADVSDQEAMQRAVAAIEARWSRLDIVVASAGINGIWAPIDEITSEEWDTTIEINLRGTFLTVRETIPLLKKQGGAIVLISSIQGNRCFGLMGATAYATTKAGQVAFGRMAALELVRSGIRVNTICPGAIETKIDDNTVWRSWEKIRLRRDFPDGLATINNGEPGRADQVADAIVFLASEASSHITGSEITIDGGESLQL